jgi:hypothetical protein
VAQHQQYHQQQYQYPNHDHRFQNNQAFVWSRVHVNPSTKHPQQQQQQQRRGGEGVMNGPITASTTCIPPPRSGAASVVVGSKLYVFGGYGGGTGRMDDFYSFDFHTSTWEEVEVLGDERPGCRENNGVVNSSHSIILFGGYNGSHWLNDLWKFDIASKRWTCLQESSHNNNNTSSSGSNNGMTMDTAATASADETNAAIGMAVGGQQNQQIRQAVDDVLPGHLSTSLRRRPSCRFGYVSVVHGNKVSDE